jgi:hypothetical protein
MSNFADVRGKSTNVLNIGGKVRTIKFDLNAYGELEDFYGSVQAAMEALQTGSLRAVRAILWAGLIHEEVNLDPHTGEPLNYTISQYVVGSWIEADMLKEVMKCLQAAMVENLPAEVKAEVAKEVEQLVKQQDSKVAKVVLTPEEQEAEEKKG